MRLTLRTIEHSGQRYETVGDYWVDDGGQYQFSVSRLGDWRKEAAVFLHEFVEAMLCQARGVTIEQIDDWDLSHQDADDPGGLVGCPYLREHAFAEALERIFVREIGLTWQEHGEAIDEVSGPRSGRSDREDGGIRPAGDGLHGESGRAIPGGQGIVGAGGCDQAPEDH